MKKSSKQLLIEISLCHAYNDCYLFSYLFSKGPIVQNLICKIGDNKKKTVKILFLNTLLT